MDSLGRRLRGAMNRAVRDEDRQNLLVFVEALKLAIMDQIEAGDTVLIYDLPVWAYDVRAPMHPLNEIWVSFEDWLRHNDLSSSLRTDKRYAETAYSLTVYPSRFGPTRAKPEADLADTWLERLRTKPGLADQEPDAADEA